MARKTSTKPKVSLPKADGSSSDKGGRGNGKMGKYMWDPNIAFDWDEDYADVSTCKNRIIVLSDFDVLIIQSCLRFVHWPTRWMDVGRDGRYTEKWENIANLVRQTELSLVRCLDVRDLLITNLMLISALTGKEFDLDKLNDKDDPTIPSQGKINYGNISILRGLRIANAIIASEGKDLTEVLPDAVDYSEGGISSKLAPNTRSLFEKLEEIEVRLEQISGQGTDYSVILDEIEKLLHAIALGINSAATSPQTP